MRGTQPVMRRSLGNVALYERGEAGAIDLSDNTNRWGAAPHALEALRESAASVMRYPQPYTATLKEALSEYLGVDATQIATGCGSNAILDAATRAFGEAGDRIAIPEPTFPMAAVFARANGMVPVPIPLTAAYGLDAAAIAASDPRIVYVCRPNNPLGTMCPADEVRDLAERLDALVIVDEAYIEFAGQDASLVPLARRAANVLVVRTMSKAFGLAGVRVGYAVGAAPLVRTIERSRGPYQVGVPSAAAAIAALRLDLAWMRDHAALAVAERERLVAALQARGIDAIPSAANFVCAPLRHARSVADRMREDGVAVRALSGLPGASDALQASGGDALRITVGPRPEIDAALSALDRARIACA